MTSTAKAALATLLAIAATAPPSALARSMVRPASTIPPTPMQPGDSIERVDVQLSFMTGARVPVIRVERKTEAFMKRMYGYVTVGTLRKRMIEQDVFGIFGNLQQQKKHAESHSVPVSTIPAQGADIVDEIRSQGANQRKGDNIASRQCREAMKPGVAFYNDMDKIQFFVDGREERLNEGVNLVKLAEQGIVEEAPFGHHRGPNAEKPVRTDADMQELVTSARAASAAREERGGEVPKLTLRVLLKQKSVPEYFMEHFPRDAPGSYSTPRWFASADPNSFNTPSARDAAENEVAALCESMSELSTGAGCGGGPTGAPELWKEVTWGQNVGHGEDLEDVELLNFELEGFDKHETAEGDEVHDTVLRGREAEGNMTSVTLLPEARRQFVGGLLRTRGHASILETLFEMWCQHFQQRRDGRVLKTSVGPNGMRLAIPAAKKFICFERLIIRDEVGGPVRFLRQHVLGDGTWHRFGQKHGMWADACAEAQAEENFHGQFMRSSGARKLIEKLWSMPLEETGIFSGAVQ